MPKNEQTLVGEITNKIYNIRGQKVMLDYDLAEIYGYTTSAFNQQVKNNIEKFEGEDFMFRLTQEELVDFLRSNFLILKTGRGEHYKYLPYAFTEQGIYMLMTVLRGELAVKQSRTLIRLFKSMKDYIVENQERLDYRSNLQLAMKVADNARDIEKIKTELGRLDSEMRSVNKKLTGVVMKSDLSPVVLDFNETIEQREYIIMDGQLAKASEIYIDLYAQAKQSIYIIDNYVSIKTLRHLQKVKSGIDIIIFSDNLRHYLHKSDYADFKKEFPNIEVSFIKTEGKIHDRFIVLDYQTDGEVVYHCGASEKDAGNKMMVISKFNDGPVKETMNVVIENLINNKALVLGR